MERYSYIPLAASEFRRNIKSVGARVRELRVAADMSQQDLAVRAEVAEGTLSELERGVRNNVSMRVLNQLAAALDCDLNVDFKER